ncbi:MAG: deoxyribodipyrimidine photo-lyase [Anaerolineales bacterium]|nr:deoxyribodipyrimidine photo-lyase [Anaerolineales bacterium]
MATTIWWIRRDLRLGDNQALAAARAGGDRVLPVFVLDPRLLAAARDGRRRLGFLFAGLRALDADLRRCGNRLLVRRGDPARVLSGLVAESGAGAVYAEADHSPYARRRDARVAQAVPLTLAGGLTVHPLEAVRKADSSPYTVFTPYSRAWRALPFPGVPLPAPEHLPGPAGLPGEGLPSSPGHALADLFPAGEAEAHRRLEAFVRTAIDDYHDTRNRMDLAGTSVLSPYLRFGMISALQAVWAARQAGGQGAEAWLNELIWREFYVSILHHFPHVQRESFHPGLRGIVWREAPGEFADWTAGRTGYPVVDAAMRQLLATGWMHNRARMIAASFLVKDLLVDWRRGEQFFRQHLLDGDLAANHGGWQWTAGTGTDAAPYYRVFNPVLQGRKFDPQGDYVHRWVPELAGVPGEFLHEPWCMSVEQQKQFHCMIGKDYPAPIVDHALARRRALEAYRAGVGR